MAKNKIILIVILALFLSCEKEETAKVYEYTWRWEITRFPDRQCSGFDINPMEADVIKITVQSDLGEFFNFTTYSIKDNMIVLYAPESMQNENFDNPELERLSIKLIYY